MFKYLSAGVLAAALVACGGGGGSAGTTAGGTSTGGTSTGGTSTSGTSTGGTSVVGAAETLLTAQLKDATTGATVQSIAAGGGTEIVATLTTKDGKPVTNQVVSLDSGVSSSLLFYPNGSAATTDANGIARIKVSRADLYEFGTATLFLIFKSTDQYSQALSAIIQYRVDPPPLQLELRDASGVVTSGIGSVGLTTLKATLKFPDGTPVIQKRIDITGDLTKVSFPEGSSQLTDSLGVATIKVSRASATVGGAGTLTGAVTISGSSASGPLVSTVVTGVVDYSVGAVVGAATLALDTLNVGGALPAYGTRQISVRAMLGTSVAPSVQVSFSSNCGQLSPATAPTNASGIAVTSFTATDVAGTAASTLGCGGKTVDISASAVGASTVSKSISVLAAPATNLGFIVPTDVTKTRIYLANSGGATQTSVQFLLSNARGEALPGQDVLVTLKTLNGGIPKATFGTVGNVAPIPLTTDSFGQVSVPVFSGTVPTNVLVNVALVSNTLIQTDSSVVAIASGRPAQARVSLGRGKSAIRGFNFDGATTTVTMSLADRQGNPVPDGTVVNFVTEGGVMIPPTCLTGAVAGDSQCTVNIRTQNPRPTDGLVSILAYAAGEENFVDANFNNVFDCDELFTDLGTAYRDDTATASGVFNPFVTGEFSVPRSASTSFCASGTTPSPSLGDGVWGAADVRGQVVVVFSTDDLTITNPQPTSAADPQWNGSQVTTRLTVSIQDANGRSVPTGSTIAAVVIDNTPKQPSDGDPIAPSFGTCALVSQSNTAVPDSLDPLKLTLNLKQCVAGDQVSITVTTPAVTKTYTFSL